MLLCAYYSEYDHKIVELGDRGPVSIYRRCESDLIFAGSTPRCQREEGWSCEHCEQATPVMSLWRPTSWLL